MQYFLFFLFAFAFYLWQKFKMVVRLMAIAKVRFCETLLLETEHFYRPLIGQKPSSKTNYWLIIVYFLLNPDHDHDRPLDWA